MNEILITALILGGLIFITLFFVIIFRSINHKQLKMVRLHSQKYKDLCLMNNEILFSSLHDFKASHFAKTKQAFDRACLDEIAIEYIENHMFLIKDAIKNIEINRQLNFIYQQKFDKIFKSQTRWANKRQIRMECDLLMANKRSVQLNLYLECEKLYTSLKGRNNYGESKRFDYDQILRFLERIEKSVIERGSEQHRRRLERGRVTDGIRFDVFRRDGFRCRVCGENADSGAKLHVDHIKPVSKGGTSDIENLQTLCQACNMGKGNKYDEEEQGGGNWITLNL